MEALHSVPQVEVPLTPKELLGQQKHWVFDKFYRELRLYGKDSPF